MGESADAFRGVSTQLPTITDHRGSEFMVGSHASFRVFCEQQASRAFLMEMRARNRNLSAASAMLRCSGVGETESPEAVPSSA